MKSCISSWKNWYYTLGIVFYIVGFALTILSWSRLCSTACAAVHHYKYFGFDFEVLGFIFFPVMLALHIASRYSSLFAFLVSIGIAGAVGSEINFIFVQKYVIEQWCPVCLTIAGIIAMIAFLYILSFLHSFLYVDQPITRGKIMKALGKSIGSCAALIVGFIVAFVGVYKPEKSFAEGIGDNEVPYFGNAESPVEVYVITDWFCPACQAIEPEIAPYYSRIMKEAKLFFIDYPIHPESMNYLPYNLSFMIKDKSEYFKIRRALHRLSKKTKTPTTEQVDKSVKAYNVSYQPLNFSDVNEGVKFMEGIVKTFKVRVTPTVVVANRKKLDAKKLAGASITAENIMKAIEVVKKESQ